MIEDQVNTTVEDCAAPCPPPPAWEGLGYCKGTAELVPAPRFSATSRPARGGGVRITSLRIAGLPLAPPFADATVAVFCTGRGCPIGARIFAGAQAQPDPLDLRSLRGRTLRPGAVIEIQVVKGNHFGRVQRYVVRLRRLTATSLCLWPNRLDPQPCPRIIVPQPLPDPPAPSPPASLMAPFALGAIAASG